LQRLGSAGWTKSFGNSWLRYNSDLLPAKTNKEDGIKDLTLLNGPALARYIDHTLLKPEATLLQIMKLCDEALRYKFKAVCVNPNYTKAASERLKDSGCLVATVVGFPLGANSVETKAFETRLAISDGASEIDMVLNIGALKSANWSGVSKDISAVVREAQGRPVKVILETGLLSTDEIIKACELSETAGAAFVKTSTGFLGRGASLEDIILMRKTCGPKVHIKASGGIKTFEQAVQMIAAGADRLGTSAGVALIAGPSANPSIELRSQSTHRSPDGTDSKKSEVGGISNRSKDDY
jgi:deoxyribose-phosphate aldolase